MNRKVFHMRMATQSGVCIDVVIRGSDAESEAIDAMIEKAHIWLDFGCGEAGMWAGIGRGEFVKEVHLA